MCGDCGFSFGIVRVEGMRRWERRWEAMRERWEAFLAFEEKVVRDLGVEVVEVKIVV